MATDKASPEAKVALAKEYKRVIAQFEAIGYRAEEVPRAAQDFLECESVGYKNRDKDKKRPRLSKVDSRPLVSTDQNFQSRFTDASQEIRDLFGEVIRHMTSFPGVSTKANKHTHNFLVKKRMIGSAEVFPNVGGRSRGVVDVYLKLDPDKVTLEEGFTRDMRNVGKHGVGDLRVRLTCRKDIARAAALFQRCYAQNVTISEPASKKRATRGVGTSKPKKKSGGYKKLVTKAVVDETKRPLGEDAVLKVFRPGETISVKEIIRRLIEKGWQTDSRNYEAYVQRHLTNLVKDTVRGRARLLHPSVNQYQLNVKTANVGSSKSKETRALSVLNGTASH